MGATLLAFAAACATSATTPHRNVATPGDAALRPDDHLAIVRGVISGQGPEAPMARTLDVCSVARLAGVPFDQARRVLAERDALAEREPALSERPAEGCASRPDPAQRMQGDWQVDSLRLAGPTDTRLPRSGLVVVFTTFATVTSRHQREYVLRPAGQGMWTVVEWRIRAGQHWSPVLPSAADPPR